MKAKTTWVLIADGARARLLQTTGWEHGLEPASSVDFIADHRPTREIGAERPGRVHESADSTRHAMAPRVDWHQFEKHLFAKEMAAMLNMARARGEFDRLVLVAPPATLGDLRKELDKPTAALVFAELDKDLTHVAVHDLKGHLEKIMPV